MALLRNGGTYADLRLRFTGGTAAGQVALERPETLLIDNEVGHQSIPAGYGVGGLVPAVKGGWLGSFRKADGAGSAAAAITAVGVVAGLAEGATTLSAPLRRGIVRTGSAAGAGVASLSSYARGRLAGAINIGFQPSADDNAQAVLALQMPALGGMTVGEVLAMTLRLLRNRTVTDPAAGTFAVFDDADSAPLLSADLWEDAAGTVPYSGNGAQRRDRRGVRALSAARCVTRFSRARDRIPRRTVGERGFDVRRNPHLEKFIQVGRNNAQVAQTLEQRNILAASPVEYPFVESKDAQIPIQQVRAADGYLTRKFGSSCHVCIRRKVFSAANSGDDS